MPQEEMERAQSKRSSGNRPKTAKTDKSNSTPDLKDDKIRTTSRRPRTGKESPVPSSIPRYNPSIRDAKRPDVPPPPVGYMVFDDEEEDDGLDNLWDFDSEDMQQTVADRPSRSRGKGRDSRGRDTDKARSKTRDGGKDGRNGGRENAKSGKNAVQDGAKEAPKDAPKDAAKDAARGRNRTAKADPGLSVDTEKAAKPVRGRKPDRETLDSQSKSAPVADSSLKNDEPGGVRPDRNAERSSGKNRRNRNEDDSFSRQDIPLELETGQERLMGQNRKKTSIPADKTKPVQIAAVDTAINTADVQESSVQTRPAKIDKSASEALQRIQTRKESTRKSVSGGLSATAASAGADVSLNAQEAAVSLREEIKRKLKEELLEELRQELQDELRVELGLKPRNPVAAPVSSASVSSAAAVQTVVPASPVSSLAPSSPVAAEPSVSPLSEPNPSSSSASNLPDAGSQNLAEKKTPDFQKEQEDLVKNSAGKSNRKTDKAVTPESKRNQTPDRIPADEEPDWKEELPSSLLKEIDFGPNPDNFSGKKSNLSWERPNTKSPGRRPKSESSVVSDSSAASAPDRGLGKKSDSVNVSAGTDTRNSQYESKDNRRNPEKESPLKKERLIELKPDSSSTPKADAKPERSVKPDAVDKSGKPGSLGKSDKSDKAEKTEKTELNKGTVDPSAWAHNEFNEFNLRPEIMRALQEFDYLSPTPIQKGVIPVVAEGKDVMGQAQTGTGKTAAFGLPLLQAIEFNEESFSPRALILVPTRELAVQVRDEIQKMGKYSGLAICAFYGGSPLIKQTRQLSEGVDIAVGTPGRVIDLMNRRALDLTQLKFVVLDEADRMLDIGFRPDIEKILRRCPDSRQTLLLSATIPPQVDSLARHYMSNPEKLDFSPKNLSVDTIDQYYFSVEPHNKTELLERLLQRENPHQAIIFCRTKRRTELLTNIVKKWYPNAEGMHGDLDQGKRMHVMSRFREGKIQILVATDVVGRGIDVSGISHIINYDIPQFCDDYVHRVGRTGRMGHEGVAYTFVTAEEGIELTRIEMRINRLLKRDEIPGFVAFTPPIPSVIPPEADKFRPNETPVEDSPAKPVFGKRVRKVRHAL